MLEDGSSPRDGAPRVGCHAALLDLTVGGFEVLVVAMTAVYTVLGAPPDSAPRSEYNHVVNIYTGVIMGTVMIVLLFYILRRRWIASALQLIVVALAIGSVVFLHRTRI